jgi:3-oxo-5-alpha-steroid 4-dehydrogenase 1
MWSFLVPSYWLLFKASPCQLRRLINNPQSTILLALFLIHYINRDFIFPLRIRGGKPTPFTIWLLAAIFCLYNGYMQTLYLLTEAPTSQGAGSTTTTLSHLSSPRFVIGITIWLAGWLINLHSDNILIRLRKTKTTNGGYKIPIGGMFEYVSAANYFGEWVEWVGWAISSWSVPAAAFAFFTFANLAPRAVKHHEWYKRKFSRYPKNRKAFIPFVW